MQANSAFRVYNDNFNAYALYKKHILLLKAGKFSLSVKGRSVMSVIHAICVSKMNTSIMCLSVL